MKDTTARPEQAAPDSSGDAERSFVMSGSDETDEAAADAFADAAEEHPILQQADEAAAQVEVDLDLAAMAAERDDYLDALRRLQADFENYKKRMLRQQSETRDRAGENLVVKLLPVLDTIDLARQHGAADGVDPIVNSLLDVLTKEGLERIDPVGDLFDPNEHEAVAHESGDGEPEVVGLLRAGYRWKGRLIRPAMVTVRG
ncbi:MAG: nucleotide exchange factor GrpE [Actinobacteria bacterium]|nr:nucleotide exchange factor GrpE [Actinomycetota bacterium]MBW3649308.1 nucleotide exchange factor GrpE [Actinomycetota bacterium]